MDFPIHCGNSIAYVTLLQWCMSGFCRSSIGGIPAPVNGAWGEWPEHYTQCSRTCGTGVTYRQRQCNNPAPRAGGKACEGPMFIMETCNKNVRYFILFHFFYFHFQKKKKYCIVHSKQRNLTI